MKKKKANQIKIHTYWKETQVKKKRNNKQRHKFGLMKGILSRIFFSREDVGCEIIIRISTVHIREKNRNQRKGEKKEILKNTKESQNQVDFSNIALALI